MASDLLGPAAADGAPVPPLRPIPLPQLLQQGGELQLTVRQPFAELGEAEPVQGWIRLRHHGPALEVEAEASTVLACRCDRCLRPFQLPLRVWAHERLAVAAAGPEAGEAADDDDEREVDRWLDDNGMLDLQALLGEDPEERIDPQATFDPEHWLFEQLSLRLPLVYHCGPDCSGPDRWSSANAAADPRWQALRQLQQDGA
ncbi:MAG: YceD family protein [Cyanobium sp.]|jgi:uncharacterized protein